MTRHHLRARQPSKIAKHETAANARQRQRRGQEHNIEGDFTMEDFISGLRKIYSNKLDSDARPLTPLFTFGVPGFDGTFGVVGGGTPGPFWVQMATILPTQSVVRVFLACIVYKFIIQKRGTLMAYMVGFGFVIPFVVLLPFVIIPLLGIHNVCLMIAISSTPIFVTFNCLEAMFGTSPTSVEKNLMAYCIYYSSPIPFLFDEKTKELVKANKSDIVAKSKAIVVNVVMTILLLSVLIPMNYKPFPTSRTMGQPLCAFFEKYHLLNNYILACLTYLCLDGGTLGVAVTISVMTGFSTVAVMHSPLSESTSPSDFWGRRWNRMIHAVLKRAVYLPLRKYFSRTTAAIWTFVASGLLHEYVLAVIHLKGNESPEEQRRSYGMHMAFFAYNGLVILIEYALKSNKHSSRYLAEMSNILPRAAITALVLLTVIPVSHWFTDEYVLSGFYSDYSLGFPRIVYISRGIV